MKYITKVLAKMKCISDLTDNKIKNICVIF